MAEELARLPQKLRPDLDPRVGSGFAIGMCGKLSKRSVFKQRTLRKRARLFAADGITRLIMDSSGWTHAREWIRRVRAQLLQCDDEVRANSRQM
jgi:hypothetical protein